MTSCFRDGPGAGWGSRRIKGVLHLKDGDCRTSGRGLWHFRVGNSGAAGGFLQIWGDPGAQEAAIVGRSPA